LNQDFQDLQDDDILPPGAKGDFGEIVPPGAK
jgi:hypothetical protein